MARAKQPVSVGGVEFDALIESEESYEADAPEYPTEEGFNVSDNIVLKPEALSMTLFITDTPVTWRNRHGSGPGRTEEVVKSLLELYFKKQPVEVITSDKVYSNMAILSLSIKKSTEVGYAREVPISFKKIIVTSSKTVTIPDSYGRSGSTGASAGSANTRSGSTSGSGSGGSSGGGSSASKSSKTSSGGSGGGSKSSGSGKSGSILYTAASGLGLL